MAHHHSVGGRISSFRHGIHTGTICNDYRIIHQSGSIWSIRWWYWWWTLIIIIILMIMMIMLMTLIVVRIFSIINIDDRFRYITWILLLIYSNHRYCCRRGNRRWWRSITNSIIFPIWLFQCGIWIFFDFRFRFWFGLITTRTTTTLITT